MCIKYSFYFVITVQHLDEVHVAYQNLLNRIKVFVLLTWPLWGSVAMVTIALLTGTMLPLVSVAKRWPSAVVVIQYPGSTTGVSSETDSCSLASFRLALPTCCPESYWIHMLNFVIVTSVSNWKCHQTILTKLRHIYKELYKSFIPDELNQII